MRGCGSRGKPERQVWHSSAAAAGARQNFSKVERFDVGQLVDLLAATEAVGDHDRRLARRIERREAGRRWRWSSRLRIYRLQSQRGRPCRSNRPGSARPRRRPGAGARFRCPGRQRPPCDGSGRGGECARRRDGQGRSLSESGALAARKSARSQTCSLRRLARGSLGKSSRSSSLKTLAQLGSRKIKGRPASICGAMRSRTLAR